MYQGIGIVKCFALLTTPNCMPFTLQHKTVYGIVVKKECIVCKFDVIFITAYVVSSAQSIV